MVSFVLLRIRIVQMGGLGFALWHYVLTRGIGFIGFKSTPTISAPMGITSAAT